MRTRHDTPTFYRLCAAEVGADPDRAVDLCRRMIEGSMSEFALACHKEARALQGVTLQ